MIRRLVFSKNILNPNAINASHSDLNELIGLMIDALMV